MGILVKDLLVGVDEISICSDLCGVRYLDTVDDDFRILGRIAGG